MRNIFLDKAKLVSLLMVTMLFVACGDAVSEDDAKLEQGGESPEQVVTYTAKTLRVEISKLENDILNTTTEDKQVLTLQLTEFYTSYFNLFPNDKLASDMIFKAGNEYVNLARYDDALAMYKKIETTYRTYQKRPEAIYLQGFIYDTYKNEFGKAKEEYEILINEYPEHILAEQARQSIENLGLTDEEIIRNFEKNLK